MLRTVAISSLIFAGAVSVANADVFRWVDEHGSVHYSDQWVPGSELIKTTKPRTQTASSDSGHRTAAVQKPADADAQVAQLNATQAVKQDVAKAHEQQCKDAKGRYEKAIQARRIFKAPTGDKAKDNPEEREYLSDEEADALRVKAREAMQELCGNSTK